MVQIFMVTLKQNLYAYDIVNAPQTAELVRDIEIEIADSEGTFSLTKNKTENQFEYELTINGGQRLKISDDWIEQDKLIEDVLLSINLLMTYVILTKTKRKKYKLAIDPETQRLLITEPLLQINSTNLSTRMPTKFAFSVHLPVAFDAELVKEVIYEANITKMLEYTRRMNVNTLSYPLKVKEANLKSALLGYKDAINGESPLDRFKSLYCSMELSANYDGSEDKGENLDDKMFTLSGADKAPNMKKEWFAEWRKLYNALKHGARDESETRSITTGISNLYKHLIVMRQVATNMIIKRAGELD